jgi:hypothetical protein
VASDAGAGQGGQRGFMPDIVIHAEAPEAEKIERPGAREADVIPKRVYAKRKDFRVRRCTLGCKLRAP